MKKVLLIIFMSMVCFVSFCIPTSAWYISPLNVLHLDGTSQSFNSYSEAYDSILDGDILSLRGNLIENDIVIDKNITINLQASGIKCNQITINANLIIDSWEKGLIVPETYFEEGFAFGENGTLTVLGGNLYYFLVNYDDLDKVTIHKANLFYIDETTKYALEIPNTSFVESVSEVGLKDGVMYYSISINTIEDYLLSKNTQGGLSVTYIDEPILYERVVSITDGEMVTLAKVEEDKVAIIEVFDTSIIYHEMDAIVTNDTFSISNYFGKYDFKVTLVEDSYSLTFGEYTLGYKDDILGLYQEEFTPILLNKENLESLGCALYTPIDYSYEIINIKERFGITLDKEEYERIMGFGAKVSFGVLIQKKEDLEGELSKDNALYDILLTSTKVKDKYSYNLDILGEYYQLYAYNFDESLNTLDLSVRLYANIDGIYYYFNSGEYNMVDMIEAYGLKMDSYPYKNYQALIESIEAN